MAEWTKEPWETKQRMRGDGAPLPGWDVWGNPKDKEESPFVADVATLNDGKRICDTVNFCAGVDLTLALEAGITLGDLVEAAQLLNADFREMLASPDLLKMALEMARSGQPLEFDSDGGPETVKRLSHILTLFQKDTGND